MLRYLHEFGGGMKKLTTILIIIFLLFNLYIISPEPFAPALSASAGRYGTDVNISGVDASFIGNFSKGRWYLQSNGALGVKGSGDVNGDGYDDIIMGYGGFNYNTIGDITYLFFGRADRLSMDMDPSTADASFVSENKTFGAGIESIIGDVNGDGFDDIAISAPMHENGGMIFLIFGKASGWKKNMNLSKSDASFHSESTNKSYNVGMMIAGAGDVNGDGCDDILVSYPYYHEIAESAGRVYLILGKKSGWSMYQNISSANASYYGYETWAYVGEKVGGVGDVNADGYDDFIITSQYKKADYPQRAYLIFGRVSGWTTNTNITEANVTYEKNWAGGNTLSFAGGDINGDGFGDIIIGAERYYQSVGSYQPLGKTYIIFGRATGWPKTATLTESENASLIGGHDDIWTGSHLEGGADITGDGIDDLLILGCIPIEPGVWRSKNQRVYVIPGRTSGWKINGDISNYTECSFLAEGDDYLRRGYYFSCINMVGDVNADGFEDILISFSVNTEGGNYSGQVYLIFHKLDEGPQFVQSVKAYSDPGFIDELDIAEVGDTVYVELTGTDKNASHFDNAAVNISSSTSSPEGFWLYLLETGFNTGKYRGSFKISDQTNPYIKLINATIGEYIKISSVMDQTKNTSIFVTTKVQLSPQQDITTAVEDEEYFVHYWNFGYNAITDWTFDNNASWLNWDNVNHNIHGTPNNGDVGTFWVSLNITDDLGNYDEHNFTITVTNTPPNITNEDVNFAMEDELYYVDYSSSDDGNGTITWQLDTNASWLEIDSSTGELSGIPTNDDRGKYLVNVSVDDDNEGIDWSKFEITVLDTNDAPVIITKNVTTIFEDEPYFVQYNATDIDGDLTFEWNINTNATWLNINKDTGELSGTPTNDDVGISFVNVTVSDARAGTDSQNFTLEVLNVNDSPEWVMVPTDLEINERDTFIFDANATDIDSGDILKYHLSANPRTNITIDPDTGLIEWTSYIEDLVTPQYILEVILSVTDGNATIWHLFEITVIPNPSPVARLLSPANNSIVSIRGTELKWTGYDEENEYLTYDLYFSKDKTSVLEFSDSAKILSDTNAISYLTEDLDAGSIYYWTIIPKDWLHYGECIDSIFNFKVNSPPKLLKIPLQKATVGNEFRLEVEASDSNPDDVQNFQFTLETAPDGMVIDPSTGVITWIPEKAQIGNHIISVWLSDGIDHTNKTFEIEVSAKVVEKKSSMPFVITTTIFIILVVILGMFISGTEVGKYKFLSLFFVPMYNRLHHDKIFDNYTRGRIHGYIQAKPGEHYNAIKHALRLKNGTLTHHTKVLEKERLISIKRDGLYTRFYPIGIGNHKQKLPPLKEIEEELIDAIRHQPGITQREIVSLLNFTQQVISYNLINLARNNIIKIEHDGRERRYYINYDATDSYQNQDQDQTQNFVQSQQFTSDIESETYMKADNEHK